MTVNYQTETYTLYHKDETIEPDRKGDGPALSVQMIALYCLYCTKSNQMPWS